MPILGNLLVIVFLLSIDINQLKYFFMETLELKKMSLANVEDTLTMSEMEEIMAGSGWSWACTGATLGLISLGIGISVSTAGIGSLAWGGMMVSAFSTGGAFANCLANW